MNLRESLADKSTTNKRHPEESLQDFPRSGREAPRQRPEPTLAGALLADDLSRRQSQPDSASSKGLPAELLLKSTNLVGMRSLGG